MPTNVYILLDQSGSMASNWVETLGTINGYVEGLAKAGHDGAVTCAAFDSTVGLNFRILRLNTRPQDWKRLSNDDAVPSGGTPLYDAVGRIAGLASADANPKGIVILMTDGEENSSRELTKEGAKATLDRVRERGWEVVHLGVDFNNVQAQASGLGTSGAYTVNTTRYARQTGAVGMALAQNTMLYTSGAAVDMAFTDDQKAALSQEQENTTTPGVK